MNIGIVTVYDSINSGSFWQAYVLGQYLSELGHTVCYLKREKDVHCSSHFLHQSRLLLALAVKRGVKNALHYQQTITQFKQSVRKMTVARATDKNLDQIDCVILGSDTIWNLDSTYFLKHARRYWGMDFQDQKIVTYAGSVGNTATEKIIDHAIYKEYVKNWDHISVRDPYTKSIIAKLTDQPIDMVCDPTLLFDKDRYANMVGSAMVKEKYMFLYYFSFLTDQQKRAIKEFAAKHNLKIAGLHFDASLCDVEYINAPDNFLNYFYYADYVITDTFHGTVFSVNLEKNFVAVNKNKRKVNDFLSSVALEDRLVDNNDDITWKLQEPIDYDTPRKKVEDLRKASKGFLEKTLS